ncbi:hypothetical protein ABZ876_37145 [Streptomyces sp. NPDC046931]|uniref:hypothetical protein n=1 Tax=Streptomyces sp. NPDC046931 TaxID=3154806 RepID=UPI0033C90B16
MAASGDYSGVLHSSQVAGYTGAEGYTGVVPVVGASSGSDAPVTTVAQPLSDETLAREFGVLRAAPTRSGGPGPGRSESAADAVLMERGEAPGKDAALGYAVPPPAADTPIDERAAEEADVVSTMAADALTAGQALAFADLVAGLTRTQQRLAARPEPTPYQALEQAKALLRRSIVPDLRISPFVPMPGLVPNSRLPYPQDLIGAGADALREQAARAVAATRPGNLGLALIQGVGLGLLDAAVGQAQGLAEDTTGDPLTNSLRRMGRIIDGIDERISLGESPWEAANSVLNPMTRVLIKPVEADQLAGEALRVAPRDWQRAVELSRESGRAMVDAVFGVLETAALAERGVSAYRRYGPASRPRAVPPTPPVAPEPPVPASPSRPGGTAAAQPPATVPVVPVEPGSGVTGKVYRNGVQRLPTRPLSRPHPMDRNLPVFDRDYVRMSKSLQRGLTDHARAVAAGRQEQLPLGRRLDERIRQPGGSARLRNAKAVFNQLERETVLDNALAHPDHAYLLQVKILGVRLEDGTLVPVETINRSFGARRGRIADHLDMAPDGTFTLGENKRWTSLVNSYSESGGVTGGRINPGSTLGKEIAREAHPFEYASQRPGAKVVVQGQALDGRGVTTALDPGSYRGSTPTPYGVVSGQ